jgi:hypothetical protein
MSNLRHELHTRIGKIICEWAVKQEMKQPQPTLVEVVNKEIDSILSSHPPDAGEEKVPMHTCPECNGSGSDCDMCGGTGTLPELVIPSSAEDKPRIYPCVVCGVMRTKSEGGTTFTVCDECWDKQYGKKPSSDMEEPIAWLGVVDQGLGHYHFEVADPKALNAFQVYSHVITHQPDAGDWSGVERRKGEAGKGEKMSDKQLEIILLAIASLPEWLTEKKNSPGVYSPEYAVKGLMKIYKESPDAGEWSGVERRGRGETGNRTSFIDGALFGAGLRNHSAGRVMQEILAEALRRHPDKPVDQAAHTKQTERLAKPVDQATKLRWDYYVCINGHRNDHANLAPRGVKLCVTPGCKAEAELEHLMDKPAGKKEWQCTKCKRKVTRIGVRYTGPGDTGEIWHWSGNRPCGPVEEKGEET